jgi:hypothetical protein
MLRVQAGTRNLCYEPFLAYYTNYQAYKSIVEYENMLPDSAFTSAKSST